VRGADGHEPVEAERGVLDSRCLDPGEQGVLVGRDAGDEPVVGRGGLRMGLDADAARQVVEAVAEGSAAETGRDGYGCSARSQESASADHHGRLADSRRSPEHRGFGRVDPTLMPVPTKEHGG
jgi:hypothetical protein